MKNEITNDYTEMNTIEHLDILSVHQFFSDFCFNLSIDCDIKTASKYRQNIVQSCYLHGSNNFDCFVCGNS